MAFFTETSRPDRIPTDPIPKNPENRDPEIPVRDPVPKYQTRFGTGIAKHQIRDIPTRPNIFFSFQPLISLLSFFDLFSSSLVLRLLPLAFSFSTSQSSSSSLLSFHFFFLSSRFSEFSLLLSFSSPLSARGHDVLMEIYERNEEQKNMKVEERERTESGDKEQKGRTKKMKKK